MQSIHALPRCVISCSEVTQIVFAESYHCKRVSVTQKGYCCSEKGLSFRFIQSILAVLCPVAELIIQPSDVTPFAPIAPQGFPCFAENPFSSRHQTSLLSSSLVYLISAQCVHWTIFSSQPSEMYLKI